MTTTSTTTTTTTTTTNNNSSTAAVAFGAAAPAASSSDLERRRNRNWNEDNIGMWRSFMLSQEGDKYFTQIFKYLERRIKLGAVIRPLLPDVFNAYRFFEPHKTRVVILGQEPYTRLIGRTSISTPIADGLCFSVRSKNYCPRSLKKLLLCTGNEFYGVCGGNLQGWAEQGVLLLNIVLTTEDVPNAHRRIGWEEVQKRVMVCLLELNIPLVFMLFGIEARQFFDTIKLHVNKNLHKVLSTQCHPAHNTFVAMNLFKKTNSYFRRKRLPEIQWKLDFKK